MIYIYTLFFILHLYMESEYYLESVLQIYLELEQILTKAWE